MRNSNSESVHDLYRDPNFHAHINDNGDTEYHAHKYTDDLHTHPDREFDSNTDSDADCKLADAGSW